MATNRLDILDDALIRPGKPTGRIESLSNLDLLTFYGSVQVESTVKLNFLIRMRRHEKKF